MCLCDPETVNALDTRIARECAFFSPCPKQKGRPGREVPVARRRRVHASPSRGVRRLRVRRDATPRAGDSVARLARHRTHRATAHTVAAMNAVTTHTHTGAHGALDWRAARNPRLGAPTTWRQYSPRLACSAGSATPLLGRQCTARTFTPHVGTTTVGSPGEHRAPPPTLRPPRLFQKFSKPHGASPLRVTRQSTTQSPEVATGAASAAPTLEISSPRPRLHGICRVAPLALSRSLARRVRAARGQIALCPPLRA